MTAFHCHHYNMTEGLSGCSYSNILHCVRERPSLLSLLLPDPSHTVHTLVAWNREPAFCVWPPNVMYSPDNARFYRSMLPIVKHWLRALGAKKGPSPFRLSYATIYSHIPRWHFTCGWVPVPLLIGSTTQFPSAVTDRHLNLPKMQCSRLNL